MSAPSQAPPLAPRPASSWFAPAVRVVALPDELQAGKEPGTPLDADVAGDIVRADVTRVNSGACQYSITFNNWYATTAADRIVRTGSEKPLGARELQGRSTPLWPRYKYNDFQLLAFGRRLRLEMRYWPDVPIDDGQAAGLTGAARAARAAQNWVPMVSGPITDMRFDFSPGSGAQVTVSGEDDLSRLKDRHDGRKEFAKLTERQIVTQVLALAGYPLDTIAPSRIPWPKFADTGGQGMSEALQDGQSYLEFIQKLADRIDFEVFVDYLRLEPPAGVVDGRRQELAPEQVFHFEPARSRVAPDDSAGDVFVLNREQNLIEFSPSIKVVDQPSQVVVKGRHRDRSNPTRVEETVPTSVLADELHIDPAKDQALTAGPDVRDYFFPGRPNPLVSANETNLDPERARALAETMLRRKARESFTIEGTTLGLPRMRPGAHVEIRGIRPPFDGFFYVYKTVHSFGGDGLRTKFSARRPGMPLPPYGER